MSNLHFEFRPVAAEDSCALALLCFSCDKISSGAHTVRKGVLFDIRGLDHMAGVSVWACVCKKSLCFVCMRVRHLLWPLNIASHVWSYSRLPSELLSCAPFANLSHLIRAERRNLRGKPPVPRERLGSGEGRGEKRECRNKGGGGGEENHNGVAFQGREWHRWFVERDKWSERKMGGQCVCCSIIWGKSPVSLRQVLRSALLVFLASIF